MGCSNQKLMIQENQARSKAHTAVQGSNPTSPGGSNSKEKQRDESKKHTISEKSIEQTIPAQPRNENEKKAEVAALIPSSEAGTTSSSEAGTTSAKPQDGPKTKSDSGKGTPLSEEQKKEFKEYLAKEKEKLDDMVAQIEAMMSTALVNQVNIGALVGNVNMDCPSDAKIVRIFTSSTFTDTKQERNYLMKYAYPQIKNHCRHIGYEFQVVDMRWGVRDEATDDHMGTELCLKELKLCQEVSTGPNFVSLLSHKYGYTAFPRLIEASDFEAMLQTIKEEETLSLFKKWYTRDDNAIPPEYVLSPISKYLPAFIGKQNEEKKLAKQTWWTESETMQQALEQSATLVFGEQYARKFIMSVTESEVNQGLLSIKDPSNHCLWLKRDIVDIDQQEKNYALSRFMECLAPEEKSTKAQTLLKELKEGRMKEKLPQDKILEYEVHWAQDGGINPELKKEHKEYLEKMSNDFTEKMISMIDSAVKKKSRTEDRVVDECLQHIKFSQIKCQNFHGREETLEKIKQYVTSDKQIKPPLVIHGESGSGKTSIMAMVAKSLGNWKEPKPTILIRFLGTTQDSSSLMNLLYSMTSQLERCLKQKVSPPTENIQVQRSRFWLAVHRYQTKKPLVIILDSLDQLDEAYDARKLLWMPANLAKGTIILSTLEEPQYECFPALQRLFTDHSNYIKVPTLSRENSSQILSSWFSMRKRQVTPKQMEMLLNAFDKCSTPLFLKLSFDEAVRWTSYISEEEMVLCDTVRASIDHLFDRLEKLHGKILFSRSLAYLTTARNGASEVELEDVLSCDDDVLNDVYMYWTPPMRRLPPLLLVRIRTDLSQYLVERGADGVRVLYWYHRQFIEAAEAKYCSDPKIQKSIHENLSDYFGGAWANGKKKPLINSDGSSVEEERYVSDQPLIFGEGQFNLRRLNNLPYHCVKAEKVDMLMEKCLANIEFLRTKLEAVGFMGLMDDYKMAKKSFPDNGLISAILGAMQLSQKGLQMDPGQIVPQMLQRLTVTTDTSRFIQECKDYTRTYIEPNKHVLDLPGGQLVHTIATHKGDVDMIDMTTDGKMILTVCQEKKEVFLWSVEEAKQIRAVQAPGQCTEAYFCMNNNWLALDKDKVVRVEDVHTGSTKMQIPMFKSSWCVAGKVKDIVVVFKKRSCTIYNLENNGDIAGTAELAAGEKGFGQLCAKAGSPNFVAITDDDQYHISILDIANKSFLKQFRGFPKVKDEDGDWTEHEVEAINITSDEQCLVYTNLFTSEVMFTDFSGTKLRSIPANEDRSYTSLQLSPDGTLLFMSDDVMVHIFSCHTLEEVDAIEQVKPVKQVKAVDSNFIITMSDDANLRIWDRTREKLQTDDNQACLPLSWISSAQLLENPRYILLHGRKDKNDKIHTVVVYDIFKEGIVKEFSIETKDKEKTSVSGIYMTQIWNKVHLVLERKLYTIDLDTMSIEMTIEGYLNRRYSVHGDKVHYTANNEIVCLTKGSMNLKLYDQKTGKVQKVMKAGQEKKMDTLTVNKSGTVACAKTDDDIMLLFDLVKGEHLYNIDDKATYKDAGYTLCINRAGNILLFSFSSSLPELKDNKEVEHFVIWDIKNKKATGRVADIEYELKYRQMGKTDMVGMTAISEVFELDDDKVLVVGLDDIVRIHDFCSGNLLHRLEGHFSTPHIYIEDKSPYILTVATQNEEGSIRLWDKLTYKCLATFTLEKEIDRISLSPDGKFFTSVLSQSSGQNSLVQWRIYHSPYDSTVNGADYPEVFSSKAQGDTLVFNKTDTPMTQDPNDVDSDPDVDSDDDDEDEESDDNEDDIDADDDDGEKDSQNDD